ncbi:MAG TPA: ABC transporter permease, partial [Methanocella sp.]|nr:ABC transporter permease [Methanocella sp.]
MDPERVLSLGKRIVMQCLRDRRTMGLIIIVPSLVMLLLGYFFATDTAGLSIGVVLADHRTGTEHLSQLIADQLNASDNVTVLYINEKDINASLNNKSVDGVIYFPPNFTRNVLASEPSYVKIITEGNNPAAAGMVAQKYANASSMALAPYLSQAARPSVPGMPQASMVSVQTEELFGEGYKTIDFFAPYILGVIAFLFVFMFTGVTFLRERSFGT